MIPKNYLEHFRRKLPPKLVFDIRARYFLKRRYPKLTKEIPFLTILDRNTERLIKHIHSIAKSKEKRRLVIIFPLRGKYLTYLFFRGIASYLRAKYGFKLYLRPLLTFSKEEKLSNEQRRYLRERLRRQLQRYQDFEEVYVLDLVESGLTLKQIRRAFTDLEGRNAEISAVDSDYLDYVHGAITADDFYPYKFGFKEPYREIERSSSNDNKSPLYFNSANKKERQRIAKILNRLGYMYMEELEERNNANKYNQE